MILKFPDLDMLRLAMTSGAAPPAVTQSAAVVGFDDQDQVWVEPAAPLPRAAQNDLRRLGVHLCKVSGASASIPVRCWPEILPLQRDPDPLDRLEQTPILFETAGQDDLGRLVVEILRLGNDRQQFRWLESKTDADEGRGLLRVVGPPYYSLLRAIDRNGQAGPRAYRERAPRVWVEVGWVHPLADHLKPPPGKLLLASAPRQWALLDEAPFRDVYEVMEFALPDGPTDWIEGGLTGKVRAALKLTPGGAADGAELWVLRDDPIEELNRFVQNSSDQMLHRLAFAVGEKDGRTVVVLRTRPSRLPPPELVLKAEAYKPYLKLPNLFAPAGRALHPPLRRDMVRRLLADDPARVVWLAPVDGGPLAPRAASDSRSESPTMGFRPETLPEDAFRPLIDWIDYVLDHEKEPLQAWVQAAQFDFEAFICDEDFAAKPKKPPAPPEPKRRKKKGGDDGIETPAVPVVEYVDKSRRQGEETEEEIFTIEKVAPSEWQRRRAELEGRFTSLEGGLDAPERRALWPQLAAVNAALGESEEAGICWLNVLWNEESASEAAAWQWFGAEAAAVRPEGGSRNRSWASRLSTASGKGREITADELGRVLARSEPSAADLRALAAYLVWSGRRESPPPAILERLGEAGRFLETHERLLPVRAMWLAWSHLARLSGGDVLALARARDRLLERLYQNGLRPEQDLPGFLRFAGPATSQRFRGVGQWLRNLAEKAHPWIDRQGLGLTAQGTDALTKQYSDLLFAFGLARLGERDAALNLVQRARAGLAQGDDVHLLLYDAFEYRIHQVLEGKAQGGPLPDHLMDLLEDLRQSQRKEKEVYLYYAVDRLRDASRILEPHVKVEPYRYTYARMSELDAALAELPDVSDRAEVARRFRALLAGLPKGAGGNGPRHRVVRKALDQAPRVGEDFSGEMLERAVAAYDASESDDPAALNDQAKLLQKALFLAAHYERVEQIQALVARFNNLVERPGVVKSAEALDVLVGQCLRALRKMGMRDVADQLLDRTAKLLAGGRDVGQAEALGDPLGQVMSLRAFLHVAAGWLYDGRERQAGPVLQAARSALFSNQLLPKDQTPLACAYAAAVGQAPVETAQARFEELFNRLANVRDTFGTNLWYSQSQLRVIESVVLAAASDDFTLGANARRWLDDDEYLVRRRVHGEYRAVAGRT